MSNNRTTHLKPGILSNSWLAVIIDGKLKCNTLENKHGILRSICLAVILDGKLKCNTLSCADILDYIFYRIYDNIWDNMWLLLLFLYTSISVSQVKKDLLEQPPIKFILLICSIYVHSLRQLLSCILDIFNNYLRLQWFFSCRLKIHTYIQIYLYKVVPIYLITYFIGYMITYETICDFFYYFYIHLSLSRKWADPNNRDDDVST
jgi:hypothetical protein